MANLINCMKLIISFVILILLLRISKSSICQNQLKESTLERNLFLKPKARAPQRTFTIDFIQNIFLKDNQPFQYISGSVLYTRIPEEYWYDRLSKMKAAGLNAIQFYVPWNFHEYEDGQYDFTGNRDLNRFLTIARQLDLLVLLRSGPYICGEWDFGGLPAWLLRKNASMVLRSSDPAYLQAVLKWYSVLMPILEPHLYQNNGSIIMVQIENEYGAYYTCDDNYLRVLYDTARSYLGQDIIIYSTDGNSYGYLVCGSSDRRIFSTVDFGTAGGDNPGSAFSALKDWQPDGPLVNSEYYAGWIDAWGVKHSIVNTVDVINGLIKLYNYSNSVSVNIYMFHGGTSFGFWNGANNPPYLPQVTSYDYDAPISEAGDTTMKYMAIRNFIPTILPNQPLRPIPPNTTKAAYGSIFMQQNTDYLTKLLSGKAFFSPHPMTMESLRQYHGYMIYLTNTSEFYAAEHCVGNNGKLTFSRIGDNAFIFTSNTDNTIINYQGKLNRNMKDLSLTVTIDQNLFILVENSGHVNYGSSMLSDVKGIVGDVYLDGSRLLNWRHFPINLTNTNSILKTVAKPIISAPTQAGLFSSLFNLNVIPQDTFLKTTNFSKGVVLINGFNLGRYWNTKGPQYTLFVPRFRLNKGWNMITLFELEGTGCLGNCFVEFVDKPILDGPIHFAL